jgi:hypothetical protein
MRRDKGEMPLSPASLSTEARAVWEWMAKHAWMEGTLTEATVSDFAATCELHVEAERAKVALQRQKTGTDEWQVFSRIYLAFGRDLKEKLRAFRLAPNGLPMVPIEKKDEKPKSALEQLKDRRQSMSIVGGA